MKQRLIDIDRAKGIGIFFVVLGHLVAREAPKGNEWWYVLKYLIYLFHMSFLMCLSGIVLAYLWKPIETINDYREYIYKKFLRLIPALILFAFIVFWGKYFMQRYVHVDNQVSSVRDLLMFFLKPQPSFSTFLWYIYALFIIYLLVPILLKLSNGRMLPVVCISLLIYFLPATNYFALSSIREYLFIFSIGMCIGKNYQIFADVISQHKYIYFLVFGISLSVGVFGVSMPRLIVGLLSIPALLAFVQLPFLAKDKFLLIIGKYIFPIYLIHTIAIGITKAIMLKFISWDYINFIYFFPILLLSGLFIPILIKRFLINRVKLFNMNIA